jgi:hypothetical protein
VLIVCRGMMRDWKVIHLLAPTGMEACSLSLARRELVKTGRRTNSESTKDVNREKLGLKAAVPLCGIIYRGQLVYCLT